MDTTINTTNQPKYKVGDYVSAVATIYSDCAKPIQDIIVNPNNNFLYKVNGHIYTESELCTNDKEYNIKLVFSGGLHSPIMYRNAIDDLIYRCERLSEIYLDGASEKVVDVDERAMMYCDEDTETIMRYVTITKLKLEKEVEYEENYYNWYVEVNGKWIPVFENFWDYIYTTIGIILERELTKLLSE